MINKYKYIFSFYLAGFTLTVKLKTDEAERSALILTGQSSVISASVRDVKDYISANFRNSRIM